MKVKHLVILAILLICIIAAAKKVTTGSVSGTITDTSQKSLAGIKVECLSGNMLCGSTTSDEKGNYTIYDLKPGTYKVQIVSASHKPYLSDELKLSAGKVVKLNPVLIPSTIPAAKPEPNVTAIRGKLAIRVQDDKGKALQFVNILVSKDNNRITGGQTNEKGIALILNIPPDTYSIKCSLIGYEDYKADSLKIEANQTTNLSLVMAKAGVALSQVVVQSDKDKAGTSRQIEMAEMGAGSVSDMSMMPYPHPSPYAQPAPPFNTEQYDPIKPNIFHSPLAEPLSTFSIDVDTANYSNVRRMLTQGYLPEPKSIRIEELVNYFAYDYPQPEEKHPFAVYTEMSVCPWNQKRNLVHIGIQGRKLNLSKAPASNLVFLLDVSGSMNTSNKLQLVKESMKMLVENLRGTDKVAIVVYAGAAGEVLPSTSGNQKLQINQALENLQAGGSTAGGAGIQLAYKIAEENYIQGGNNRIILCTDGDFNVGASSSAHLSELVEQNRNKGIYLTTLGYGMGNYKDNTLELLADKGNGNYAYIDNIQEAKKFLVNEMASTLYAIAKDVKLQIEFNPTHVKAYRLIGYENRLLNKEDFKDDTKDAGELGAGHNVTAVYEIIPMSSKESVPELDELKYQDSKISEEARKSPEAMTVKLRYKLPDSDTSIPFEVPVKNDILPLDKASENYLFSAAVIGYGLMLQNSEFKEALTWQMVKDLAKANLGKDAEGYRAEFIDLIDIAAKLWDKKQVEENRDFNKGY